MQMILKFKRLITIYVVIILIVALVLPTFVFANESSVKVTAISASSYHALALKSNGTVWGWGNNSFGRLGDGSTVSAIVTVPVLVQGLSGVSDVSAGGAFSLALKTDGTVWSWGYNNDGQLGDGTRLPKLTPVQVKGLEHIVAISAGINHSLALKDDGTVWAWGNNLNGALGLGKNISMQVVPVQVNGINNVSSIVAGYNSSYAIKSDGTVWSWGLNDDGQLGNGSKTNEFQPVQITSLSDVNSLKAGKSALALKTDGTVWQWGGGLDSNGTIIKRYYPELVPELNNVSTIANGGEWNVAVKLDGSVWVWGYNVCDGNGVRENTNQPRQVKGLQDIKNADSGNQYFLAQAYDGTVWAWGDNAGGVFGDGTTIGNLYPVKSLITNEVNKPFVTLSCFWGGEKNPVYNNQSSIIVVNLSTRIDLSTINTSNISITDDQGQSVDFFLSKRDTSIQLKFEQSFKLGVHYKLQVSNLVDVWGNSMDQPYQWGFTGILPGFMTPSQISAGGAHSIAIKGSDVYSWGNNSFGQLGDGTTINRLSPVKVSGLVSAQVFAGGNFNLARSSDGSVMAWGDNNQGQLGDGTLTNRSTPVKVLGLSDIMGLAAGDEHSLALRQDGTVWAWGNNAFGQLGDGTFTTRSTPVQVVGLTNVIHIASGGGHSLAVKDDGTVWAWGDNGAGQLGNRIVGNSQMPMQVQGLTDVIAVTAGFEHSFALKKDQSLWAWGNNNRGQLGDGTNTARTTPVHILDNIIKVDAGYEHSMARNKDGLLLVWGSNTLSQLGDDSDKSYTSTPQVVQRPGYASFSDNFSAGGAHSLVEGLNNDYWLAWGLNFDGQLGDGSTYHRSAPEVLSDPDEGIYYRLSGQDRVETSIMVSQEGWNYGASAVILARSDNFPDALTGAPLGYAANAPILLTDSKVLTPATQDEIERLSPRTIYILGSTGAISQTIEDILKQNYKIVRLGGTDRYDTAAKIAEYLKEIGFATTGKAVVAYGENFPDALAVSSLAAYQHIPILLSETNELPASTQAALTKLQVNETIVVGGNVVISQKVADLLPKAVRYSGKDRYETAFVIAQKMGADTGLIYLATGNNFPDALAGSSLAARTNSPILLIDQNLSPTGKQYLASSSRKPLSIFLLGGESVVPDSVLFDLPL